MLRVAVHKHTQRLGVPPLCNHDDVHEADLWRLPTKVTGCQHRQRMVAQHCPQRFVAVNERKRIRYDDCVEWFECCEERSRHVGLEECCSTYRQPTPDEIGVLTRAGVYALEMLRYA